MQCNMIKIGLNNDLIDFCRESRLTGQFTTNFYPYNFYFFKTENGSLQQIFNNISNSSPTQPKFKIYNKSVRISKFH